ncbi:major capsid protein [Microbacterium phage Triscuit]|nr:major capsid protein [Microbacterium phage Triscuit]
METISPEGLIQWLMDDSNQSLTVFARENGINERADVIRAADGTDLNEFWNEVNATIAIRNRDRTSILDRIVTRVDGVSEEITTPSEVEFEEATEFGQPMSIKGGAARFFRGFDFKFWDLAIRYTWMYIAEAGLEQLRMNHNLALEADVKLRFQKLMGRLFNPLNGNGFTEKNEAVTVFAAYNGDGEVPPKYNHETFTGSHNHYLVSGGATITHQNLSALANELGHHGYTLPNNYELILWVNKQEGAVIRTFKVDNGAEYDFVPNAALYNGKIWVPTNGQYVGGPQGVVQGEIGTWGPFHVVEEGYIPAGYVVAIATNGPDRLGNPVGFREHSNPDYRGLKVIPGQRSQYPLLDSFYRRGFGTGIRHRGALAIMQVKATGNYQIPAAYDPAA